jgi:hypothetical protein
MLIDAAKSGFFDATLNYAWDVPYFQFYMGDLTSIPEAANYPAHQPITVDCKWNRNILPTLEILTSLYLHSSLRMDCIMKSNGK